MALTNNDLLSAARTLGCEVAAIRAVDEVESSGLGFKNGQIVIRFETAWFKKYTGLTVAGSDRTAFAKAAALNAHAALMSTSWGRYQIMGFNHAVCGYSTVEAFVEAMKESEQQQLAAFVQFIQKNGLADELQRHDWKGFAYRYNGSGYAANRYDTKLAAAYAKYAKQVVQPDAGEAAAVDPAKKKDSSGPSA